MHFRLRTLLIVLAVMTACLLIMMLWGEESCRWLMSQVLLWE